MGLQSFCGKGSHPLLWAGSRTARGDITISGIFNCLTSCEIYTVFTSFTNVAASGRLETRVMPTGPARCKLNFPRNQWCRISTKNLTEIGKRCSMC
jgi:hypothetical protein